MPCSILEKRLDKIQIPQNCLDVLAQHIYGIAIESRRKLEDVWALVRRSYCYRSLSRHDFNEVIKPGVRADPFEERMGVA